MLCMDIGRQRPWPTGGFGMTRHAMCFLLSLTLVQPTLALVQPGVGDLAHGIRQVEEGDLAAAVITLDTGAFPIY